MPSTLLDNIGFLDWMQIGYALHHMVSGPRAKAKLTRRRRRWALLLILPYLGLCFPYVYARSTPALWGFPFFYWYQFAWVIAASALLGFVYLKLKN
jgi:hypothetical protein